MPLLQGKACHLLLIFSLFLPSQGLSTLTSESLGITQKVGDLFVRWRYAGKSLGSNIAPPQEGEWESLLKEMTAFKGEVESPAKSGEDRSYLLDEYLLAYEAVLMLFAAADPDGLEAVNKKLSLTIGDTSAFEPTMKGIKSGVLTDGEFAFRLRRLSPRMVELAYTRNYLDRLREQGKLLRSSNDFDELLFSVARGEIVERLKKSSEFVESILTSGQDGVHVKPQEREARFRTSLLNSLKDSSEVSEAFDIGLDWIDPEWSSRFLNILEAPNSYVAESEGVDNFTDSFFQSSRDYLSYSPVVFFAKVGRADFELSRVGAKELETFLCRSFTESIQEAIRTAWLSLRESEGKEDSIRTFFDQTMPPISCDFLKQWDVETRMEMIHRESNAAPEKVLNELVEKLTHIVRIKNDSEAFLSGPADMESAVRYYQAKQFRRGKKEDVGFRRWLAGQLKPQSYSELKSAFLYEYAGQERMGRERPTSKFLKKLSEVAGQKILRMDDMAKFFRFDEEERTSLTRRELPGVVDSEEDRELLQEIVLLAQKKRYPILDTEVGNQSLLETLGSDVEQNSQAVLLALQEIRNKIQESIVTVNSWEKLEDMELALKNSQFLLHQLVNDSLVSGLFVKNYENLQKVSDVKLMAKSLFHKYVGVGFGMLILVDFGPAIFKHIFRWAKGASYLRTMQQGIDPGIKHGFIISAFSLIGVDLLYETWDVFGEEWPAFKDARQLYQSSALSETEVLSHPEYVQMDEYMDDRKTSYYWQAAIDGTFISLLVLPRIPWIKRQIPAVLHKMVNNHFRKTSTKTERAFKNLGIDSPHITWNKQSLEDVHRLRIRELESKRLAQENKIQELMGDVRPIKKLRKIGKFKRAMKEDGGIREAVAAYDRTLAEMERVHSGYRFLLDKYAKFQKAWERHGLEYRFDFEKLGLPAGEWNWNAINGAYEGFKKAMKNDQISAKEFAQINESFQRLADFMMRKLHTLKNYPTVKELFLQSVVRDKEGVFLKGYGQRLSENGLHLGYDVIHLKPENSTVQELIIPRLYRQKLLPKEGGL